MSVTLMKRKSLTKTGRIRKEMVNEVRANYRFSRIIALGPDKVISLEHQLFSGVPPSKMAEIIKDEWKDFPDLNIETLGRLLRNYKSTVIMPKALNVAQTNTTKKTDAQRALDNQRDVAKGLSGLLTTQEARVMKMLERENPLPTVIRATSDEIRLLMDLYNALGKFQVSMGLVRKFEDGGVININASTTLQQFSVNAQNTTQIALATQKVLSVLEKRKYLGEEYTPTEQERYEAIDV